MAQPSALSESSSRHRAKGEFGIEAPPVSPSKPDTAPSLRTLSDDELKPYFNEWMRRKMKARRAKPADPVPLE